MPARPRTIGPEVSVRINRELELIRERRGWTRAEFADKMGEYGYDFSAQKVYQMEKGVVLGKGERRVRMLTVDELAAFAEVLSIAPHEVMQWLFTSN